MGTKVSSKIQVLDRDLRVAIPELNAKEQNSLFKDFARGELRNALAINKAAVGYMPDYETRLDGMVAPLESATVKNVIEFEFELANDMVEWIRDMLLLNSPVGDTGDTRPGHPELYARSHLFFADQQLIDEGQPVPKFTEGVFVNIQPYARKIERGLSDQAREGVYEVVAAMARRRYSNYGDIRFTHRTPYNFGAIHEWANTTTMPSPYRRGENRDEWLRRQPAIIIRM